jgi:apolipoprotein N-acyltransferase
VISRDQQRDRLLGDLHRIHNGFQTPIIFGALTGSDGSPDPYNSAILLDKNDEVRGRHDKTTFTACSEDRPFYQRPPFIKRWVPDRDHLSRGIDVTLLPFESETGTVRIAPMIGCEDIVAWLGRRIARLQPNLLVNLTNDTWFGNTSEPWQHLALSVYRAVEMRLDLVRAVDTGVSAFIDSTGRVYASTRAIGPDVTPAAQPETLLQKVALQQLAPTVYAGLGEWFGISCLVLTAVLLLRFMFQRM